MAVPSHPGFAEKYYDKGYYATLGVSFAATTEAIAKKYKRLALKHHPDKNPGPQAVDEFQKITTAYHVLIDPEKRKNYDHFYMIRCLMSQCCPPSGALLRPHYAFTVAKSKHSIGAKGDRLLVFDLLQKRMRNYKKDEVQKEFPLSAIKGVNPHSSKPLELTILFKSTHPYYIRCRCANQARTLTVVLQRIASNSAEAVTDASLRLATDDEDSPSSSVQKSRVVKRAANALEWQGRFMVMGATQVLLFRKPDVANLVNVFPIELLKLVRDPKDVTVFTFSTPYWKASFRVHDADVAKKWHVKLGEQQAFVKGEQVNTRARGVSIPYTDSDLSGAKPSGTRSVRGLSEGGPPLPRLTMYSEASESTPGAGSSGRSSGGLAAMRQAAAASEAKEKAAAEKAPAAAVAASAASGSGGTAVRAPLGGDEGGPTVVLAPSEAELQGGWFQYSDDLGRLYYYHEASGETTWVRPGRKAASEKAADAEDEHSDRASVSPEADAVRQQQFAALAEDHGTASSLAASREGLLASLLGLERGIKRTRRVIDSGRPIEQLSAVFEQLQKAYDKVDAARGAQARAEMGRVASQREFLSAKRAELDAMQSDVLGEDPSAATSALYKSSAFVAETFCRASTMRGMI